jgi:oligopeptidase B
MKNGLIISILSLTGVSCMHKIPNTAPSDFPQAEQVNHKLEKHGDIRNDKYFWLRERENPKVIQYLNDENAYTDKALAPARDLEQALFEEMKRRTKEDESSTPYKKGDFYYYSRFEKDQQYPIYARKKGSLTASEEILLNVNELAKDKSYCEVGGLRLSPNQEIMAYGVDFTGRRFYDIHFKNLKTGKTYSHTIDKTTGNMVWAADNQTIFFTQQNAETLRSDKVFRYDFNSHKSEQIYFEKDDTYNVYVSESLAKKYIYLISSSTLTTETRYLPSDKPRDQFKMFLARQNGHEYSVTDGDDAFYIVTNKNAKNYKLVKTDFQHTDSKHWKDVIPHSDKNYVSDVTVFKDYLAVNERREGLTQIRVLSKDLKTDYHIPFSDKSYLAGIGTNAEYDSQWLRYDYESMRRPDTTYDFNMATHAQELKKTKEIPTYNADLYVTDRIFVTAADGAQVPVSILMRKDTPKNGTAPMLIYGYGSYGLNMDPWFSQSILSLVDRGYVYAIAHIRGGSEMGRDWFDHGRVLNKKNSFTDFISCTEAMIKQGFASPHRVFAMGGSAGGLLMGAITNMRPDLYKGIVAQVAFVDVITTMLDDTIPLTTGEYDQWGNPNEKKYYDYIKSYSPYDNVTPKAYPNMLITTGLHDSQVQYWEPAKWAAKIREVKTNNSLVLLKTNMEAGHGGASGRFERMKETATDYAFILMIDQNY